MRVSYTIFMTVQNYINAIAGPVVGALLTLRQYAFVKLSDPLPDTNPLFPEAPEPRMWAVVDDPAVIARMRAGISADCVDIAGQLRPIDYDPELRPTLVVCAVH